MSWPVQLLSNTFPQTLTELANRRDPCTLVYGSLAARSFCRHLNFFWSNISLPTLQQLSV